MELPHRCWTYIGAAAESLRILSRDDLQYLWLPLSHSFGKMLEAVQLQIGFPTAVDGRMERIVENLAVVRPTFMAGPPRIFEKVHGKIVQTVEEEGGIKCRCSAGPSGSAAGCPAPGWRDGGRARWCAAQHLLADRLVLAKIRDRLGGRIRFMVSGSAALSPDIATWFHAAGLLDPRGLRADRDQRRGLRRAPGAPDVRGRRDRRWWAPRSGSPPTGRSIRGPAVMRGYHNLPEATAEVLGADGWFATGDVGEIDVRAGCGSPTARRT